MVPVSAVVVAPAPAPYREPLFAALAARPDLDLRVVYLSGRLAGWDVQPEWFASEHGYPARVLEARQLARAGRSPVVVPGGLGRALSELSPQLVVVWEFGPAALQARSWCTRRRRPLVHFSELGAAAAETLPTPQRTLQAFLVRSSAGAIGASSQARRRLLALGSRPERTFMSLQSVDAEPIRRAVSGTSGAPRKDGPLRLLCVARLVPDKNLEALIDAVAAAGPGRVVLDLVGDGPLRSRLREHAAARGASVRLQGPLSTADTALAYAGADALALVSRHEPFGVALREGAAAGLPLIASARAGATGDVAIDGENAIVVDPDDPAAIAAAVSSLARDPARRATMAAASLEIDRRWPLQRSVDDFAAALLTVAELSRTGRTRSLSVSTAASQR